MPAQAFITISATVVNEAEAAALVRDLNLPPGAMVNTTVNTVLDSVTGTVGDDGEIVASAPPPLEGPEALAVPLPEEES